MEIIKDQIDELNANIKIQLVTEDYNPKVESALKDIKKKANMKGFRPGMVPMGLVKKMYGQSVIVDEVNKLISESLTKYIKDENLNIIGEPIPSEKQQTPIDFDTQKEFEFIFDIGLRPEFELTLNKKLKIPFYNIQPDDELINRYIEQHTSKHGTMNSIDEVIEGAFMKGDFVQLDEEGNNLEEGIVKEMASVSTDHLKDEEIKKAFIGAKINDEVKVDFRTAFSGDSEFAGILGVDKDNEEVLSSNYKYIIKEISKFDKAEVNQELFDKVYGEGEVKSEEEFKEKIIAEIKLNSVRDSDYKFLLDAREKLISKIEVPLPEDFLKRWLLMKEENKEINKEEFEKDFPKFMQDIKWQLITAKVVEEQKIEVSPEEVKDLAIQYTEMQFVQYGLPAGSFPKEQLEQYATEQFLKKEDEVRRLYDKKFEDKVVAFIKETVKLDEKEISVEDFNKMFEEKK
ncbi:MAG: trigger factor [Bacteroidota bacterium]